MCEEAVRRLCNPSESRHVRKVARLLAQAVRGLGECIIHTNKLTSFKGFDIETSPLSAL
jgi:hypothetical protein